MTDKEEKTDKKSKKIFIIIGIIIILIVIAIAVWYSSFKKEEFTTIEVKKQSLQEIVDVSGIVESEQSVILKSTISGNIINIPVKENIRVKTGTPLLRVDAEQLLLQLNQTKTNSQASISQAQTELNNAKKVLNEAIQRKKLNIENLENQVKKARSNLDFLRKELARNENLYNEGAISKQTVENQRQQFEQAQIDLQTAIDNIERTRKDDTEIVNAKTRLEQAETNLENSKKQANASVSLAQENYENSVIYSPFSGSITNWQVDKGDYVTPGMALGNFQDLEDLMLNLSVNELDLPKIDLNDTVEILFDAYPEKVFKGKISWISEASILNNENIQSFPVKVTFENNNKQIKPGMSGDAKIIVEEKDNVLAIPIGAVRKKDDKYFADILVEDKKVETEIVPGISTLDNLEITKGLKEGDKLIVDKELKTNIENGK